MQIDDLTAGLSLSFIIHLNNEELQFESRILEVYSRRHTLLAEGVFTDVAAQNFCQNFSKLLTKLFGKYFRYL